MMSLGNDQIMFLYSSPLSHWLSLLVNSFFFLCFFFPVLEGSREVTPTVLKSETGLEGDWKFLISCGVIAFLS